LPKITKRKAKAALYPEEEAAVLACTAIPLPNRMLYGFVAREGMRSSEALRMTWGDLDLERGAVRLDVNKTDDPRAWALDPGTALALRRWRKILGSPADDSYSTPGRSVHI
jgi:integrase